MNEPFMRTDPEISISDDEVGGRDQAARRNMVRAGYLPPKMNVVIKGKDEKFKSWSHSAEVESLSSSGAGFLIATQCPVGSLVSLMMPMPAHLRKYDHRKRLYRVWGLVQYCYEAGGEDSAGFHVGVALIGKDAPKSYARQPMQSYRICGMDKRGLWKIEELEEPFMQRASMRYWTSLEVSLYQLNDEQRKIATEKSLTENISESGALVFSDLRVAVGDKIKIRCSSPPFSSLCVVRHRRIGLDDRTRIHLAFVENSFPVSEIEAPIEEDGEH